MIGIFGDSYGHENKGDGWPTILGGMYKEEFENFALSGTSIPYSYDLLCEKDLSRYSKVIFISTEPRRLHFIDKKTNKELLWNGRDYKGSCTVNTYGNLTSYDTAHPLSTLDRQILQYQERITAMYPDTWDSMAKAMKNDVLRSHTNILLLDIYELVKITNLDNPCEHWWETYKELPSRRVCHLSKQQNIELAGYIKDYFDDGFDIHSILRTNQTEHYFTKSNSPEEAGYRLLDE